MHNGEKTLQCLSRRVSVVERKKRNTCSNEKKDYIFCGHHEINRQVYIQYSLVHTVIHHACM